MADAPARTSLPRRRGKMSLRDRPWLGEPPSLRLQMAAGSAALTLVAVMLVGLAALITVSVTFAHYQRQQLATSAVQVATSLGAERDPRTGAACTTAVTACGSVTLSTSRVTQRFGTAYLWIMDGSGHVTVPAASSPAIQQAITSDTPTISAALRGALRGTTTSGTLQGNVLPFFADRTYIAMPVRASGSSKGPIIGAIALSAPPRLERVGAVIFLSQVSTALPLVVLGTALLAALAALLFSRRLTRPLARLSAAAACMASGDYAVRVAIDAPREYRDLATAFNEMAGALERDVGEIRRQERLRRELVANVSHELATPLTAIEGFTEALADGLVENAAAREETVRTIARESARLHRLVDQLRQGSLFASGTASLDRAPLQLAILLRETLAVLAPELERQHRRFVTQVPDGLPLVYADGDRVTEILLNLLDNALRHAPPGGLIEVTAAPHDRAVWVSIADSGTGIAPEQRERVFERFYRLEPSRSAATGGSGLGLSIVKDLIEAHGGTIWLDERPGGGARFTFALPISR